MATPSHAKGVMTSNPVGTLAAAPLAAKALSPCGRGEGSRGALKPSASPLATASLLNPAVTPATEAQKDAKGPA
jgi:hypothetical protein